MSRSPAQAETAQDSDRKESKARSRDLASISAPRLEGAATRLPLPVRELMALNRNPHVPAAGRQAIFLGTTEPRAARPRKAPPRSDAK